MTQKEHEREVSCKTLPSLKIGAWNVRGCGSESKRCVIAKVFEERSLDVLAVCETKLKGKGEVWFGNVRGWKSGVGGGHGREGVALFLGDRLSECVTEIREVSSRVMWVKIRFGGELWAFVSVYGPGSERSEEEREEFWGLLNETVECIVVVLGDLNARVGDDPIEGVIGNWGCQGGMKTV